MCNGPLASSSRHWWRSGADAYSIMSTHQERAVMRASLQQLDSYEIDRVRDQELLGSLKDRAFRRCSRA